MRRAVEFEHGGSRANGLNWYLAGNLFAEDGWREDSPSDVGQLFGKLGWQRVEDAIPALSVGYANNSLTGNGLQEQRFLDRDYASVYTKPGQDGQPLDVAQSHDAATTSSRALTLTGNAYYRHIRTSTFNGDINEDSLDQSVYQPSAAERAALAAAGYTGFPASGATAANTPFPSWRCIGNVLLNDEPAEKCNGLLNRSETAQHNYGVSGQLTRPRLADARAIPSTLGAGYDGSALDVRAVHAARLSQSRSSHHRR